MKKQGYLRRKNNKGFSLIELIIAIAILVILTGLLAPNVLRYVEKSREAKDEQTIDTVSEAMQAAFAEASATGNWSASKDIVATFSSSGVALTGVTASDEFDTAFSAIVTKNKCILGSSTYSKGGAITMQSNGTFKTSADGKVFVKNT